MSVHVVWFKNDLRLRDHRPLAEAAKRGRVLCLYVYEPELLYSAEFDPSRLVFINQSLAELDANLRDRGVRLVYRVGSMPDVLATLHREHSVAALWSHEETGVKVVRERNERVRDWAEANGVPWHEYWQRGVFKGLQDRDGWAGRWNKRMREPVAEAPERIDGVVEIEAGRIREAGDVGLDPAAKPKAKLGGESEAHAVLESFLHRRGETYRQDMSSPLTGWESCSRLSVYLSYGNISIKQVWQATQQRRRELKELRDEGHTIGSDWLPSLASFDKRLHWHGHFIQRLEDDPSIEFRNLNRAFDGLREDEFNQDYFDAWCAGKTGYPLVDACMRALHQSGWINFRMRAMLVSFASYHLWLHWRPTALYLARHFLDFEAGIHYNQFQMQSGVTGINTLRIYNPTKQVHDQDPDGVFIRRYVPELEAVPTPYIAEPHTLPPLHQRQLGCVIGEDYPEPIVDHKTAYRDARERVQAVKQSEAAKQEAKRVLDKHGSRKNRGRKNRRS